MNSPGRGDYIDIHNHGSVPQDGVFAIDTLMAHEGIDPVYREGMVFSVGIHPWHLNESNQEQQLGFIRKNVADSNVVAVGEAGYDRLKGPAPELQRKIFEDQVKISEDFGKPLIIHCVRSWDELMASHKRLKPSMPWIIHGFRGKKELARQLISRGMYLSFWFAFILRPEAADLMRSLPPERIFLETDGSGVSIRDIYGKVALDLGIGVADLQNLVLENYNKIFRGFLFSTAHMV